MAALAVFFAASMMGYRASRSLIEDILIERGNSDHRRQQDLVDVVGIKERNYGSVAKRISFYTNIRHVHTLSPHVM